MKRLFFLITLLIFFFKALCLPTFAEIEPIKVMSLNYDVFSSVVTIGTRDAVFERVKEPLKFITLTNPNRIYFDIKDAVLVGGKQQLVFEKSPIKEIRLAQFETEPVNIVRAVITFEEDFDASKIKLTNIDSNIIVKISKLTLENDYFNTIYDEKSQVPIYSGIVANSQAIQKVSIPTLDVVKPPGSVMDDINRAFENSLPATSAEEVADTVVSVDLSSNLKLRTKYFINQYIPKNEGLLVSGLGQITTSKKFYLDSPKRVVIDLPNTFLDRSIRNKELALCQDGSCNDIAKIGQFDYNIARIVITSDKAEKYLPIYSQDMQSLFLVDSDKLNHTSLVSNVSNINRAFVRRIDSKTNELILSFSSPIVHSILRTENSLNFFLFNVQSYNEQELIKVLNNSAYKQFTLSLLPQIGVRAAMPIGKNDLIKIEESLDAKALKITITKGFNDDIKIEKPTKKNPVKDKIVLDAGHGGTDYGAIREGINEKDITLDITQRVDAILRSKGYRVSLVRSDDSYVSLEDRAAFNESEGPEIFVSIHVNSAVSNDPNGIETHWYHDNSKELAEIIHKHMTREIKANDRGLFKSKFYVINHTVAPAVLCEIGFLSNATERNELVTEARKQKTAKAIAEGIIEYLKGRK